MLFRSNNKHKDEIEDFDKKHDNVGKENTDKTVENVAEPTTNDNESLEERYNTLNDKYIRLTAEFDNYRKRTAKEKIELIKTAGEYVIEDTLPIVDNFERALKNMATTTDVLAIKEGVELIYQQLMSMLKLHGVKAINTEGKEFDTEYHEAITTVPAPTQEEKGKIIDCTQKGYILNDKVIRHFSLSRLVASS